MRHRVREMICRCQTDGQSYDGVKKHFALRPPGAGTSAFFPNLWNYWAGRPRRSVPPARIRVRIDFGRHLSRKGKEVFLFILDSLGSSELLVILGAALIFFGPRKLPQLSRQIGKSLAEFRRASDDFKRTWEREVNLENIEKGVEPKEENSILDRAAERIRAAREVAAFDTDAAPVVTAPSITPVDPALVQPHEPNRPETVPAEPATSKHDWL